MKKIIYLLLFLGILAVGAFFLLKDLNLPDNIQESILPPVSDLEIMPPQQEISEEKNETDLEEKNESKSAVTENIFTPPLNRTNERVSKKPFGIFVTPERSPVQPEKFLGYHTGTDFEIFPDEVDADVEIKAMCSGKLLIKKNASGYGGVAVQSCDLEGAPITVVYGHLKLDSIKVALGDDIVAGEPLGVLGKAYSSETSGERKHLHLSMYKGSEINILGYVSSKKALLDWLDPILFLF